MEELQKEDKRIFLIHKENGGVSSARNTGIEQAKGEYIVFLDADDELTNDSVESLLKVLVENEADVCAGYRQRFSEDCLDCTIQEKSGEIKFFEGEDALLLSLKDEPESFAVWGKIYKRKTIEDVRFPEGKRIHEDSFFLFLCFTKMIKFAILDKIIYKYHVVSNSASRSNFSEKFFDILDLAKEKEKIIQQYFPQYNNLGINMRIKAYMTFLFDLSKVKGAQYKRQEKEAIKYIRKNKKYFIPSSEFDKKWFFIITHRLYKIYKTVNAIKNR